MLVIIIHVASVVVSAYLLSDVISTHSLNYLLLSCLTVTALCGFSIQELIIVAEFEAQRRDSISGVEASKQAKKWTGMVREEIQASIALNI